MKLERLQGPHETYPFVPYAGPWRVGDRVAYTREYCDAARGKERAARKRWRGVIISCSCGGTMLSSFLVFEGAPTFETWAQHPHVLRLISHGATSARD